jgi:lysophospholipid acyltransferase (LPLAT)-like uncharacterized protein
VFFQRLDVWKMKFKHFSRTLIYSSFFQKLFCWLVYFYMQMVFYTCKKKFINEEVMLKRVAKDQPLIIVFWHNRLMMIPYVALRAKKLNSAYNFLILASRNKDGKFVRKVMSKFKLATIAGSSAKKRQKNKGIDLVTFRKLFKSLKAGTSLALTPDGPRGPNQKINGELIEISKISGVPILPISYSTSCYIKLNSWDKFFIPLPFSTICYSFGKVFEVSRSASKEEVNQIRFEVEKEMNRVQEESKQTPL